MVTSQIILSKLLLVVYPGSVNMHVLYLASYSRFALIRIQSCEFLIQYHADRIQRNEKQLQRFQL